MDPFETPDSLADAPDVVNSDLTVGFDIQGAPAGFQVSADVFNTGTVQPALNVTNPDTHTMFPQPQIAPAIPSTADSASHATLDVGTVTRDVSQAALAALQLVSAWHAVNSPQVNTTARMAMVNGTVLSAGDNGLITVRAADGTLSSRQPPVGQPQMTTSGNIVVNNGNGTYTLIDSVGQRSVKAYSATGGLFSGLSSSLSGWMLPVGLGVGALVLWKVLKPRRAA